jgi:hypothetical protein
MNSVKKLLIAMSICLSIQQLAYAMRHDDPNDLRSPAGQRLVAAQVDTRTAITVLISRNWEIRRHDLATLQRLEQEGKRREEQKKSRRIKIGILYGEMMMLLSAL